MKIEYLYLRHQINLFVLRIRTFDHVCVCNNCVQSNTYFLLFLHQVTHENYLFELLRHTLLLKVSQLSYESPNEPNSESVVTVRVCVSV